MRNRSTARRLFAGVVVAAAASTGLVVETGAAHAAEVQGGGYSIQVERLPDGTATTIRWNPCAEEPITWQVNVAALAKPDRRAAVREAKTKVAEVGRLSGLRFAFAGTTTFVPREGNERRQPAKLVVAYVRPGQTDYALHGRIAGRGGYSSDYVDHADGTTTLEVVRGYVVIDVPQTNRWSTALTRDGVSRPALLAHEIGHAVGLGHVNDRAQVMHPVLTRRTPHSYASGDRAGLARVGAAAGCARTFDLSTSSTG